MVDDDTAKYIRTCLTQMGTLSVAQTQTWNDALDNDPHNDLVCNIISFVIEQVGADAVLAKVPNDWEPRSNRCEYASKDQIAWWWLWDQLLGDQSVFPPMPDN